MSRLPIAPLLEALPPRGSREVATALGVDESRVRHMSEQDEIQRATAERYCARLGLDPERLWPGRWAA